MVFIDKPVALVPSVAIHLNREANKGFEFNRQNHLQVILSSDSEAKDVLKTLIADKIKEDHYSRSKFIRYTTRLS